MPRPAHRLPSSMEKGICEFHVASTAGVMTDQRNPAVDESRNTLDEEAERMRLPESVPRPRICSTRRRSSSGLPSRTVRALLEAEVVALSCAWIGSMAVKSKAIAARRGQGMMGGFFAIEG